MREARKAIRFPLEASVIFFWKGANGMDQQGTGRSRDVSEHGVFVFTESCPPLGAKVDLSISLPEAGDIAQALRLQIEGHVLRVHDTSGAGDSGFAVLSEQTLLKNNN
jgi:hypothetical protein